MRFFLKSSSLRSTCTVFINNCSPPSVCIYYYMCAYITEKRNKTSSRELLLLLKSDDRERNRMELFLLESFLEMRFERKKTRVLLFRVYTIRVEQLPLSSLKFKNFGTFVFSLSRHILLRFLCVLSSGWSSSNEQK